MKLLESDSLAVEIYDLLYRFGVSADSIAFFHTAYAVRLAVEQPQLLLLVTKWLYPEVARHYHTNWKAVERNIRRVVAAAWRNEPALLCSLARGPLPGRPAPAQFLSILAAYFSGGSAA
nr:sporulation initiation factor Spo0A C-terminal domain-containing protein [uncultured Oscillibacter sp.]